MFQGVGIELIVPIHSPVLQTIEVTRSGRVRRAKLYYLRERIGKAAKLKEIVEGAKSTVSLLDNRCGLDKAFYNVVGLFTTLLD
jgi:hypothetical protein